jgi:predicted nucleotidyltransferase
MRLTPQQAETIRHSVQRVFGPEARVWLFGSRVDDRARGGDIDLYIEAPGAADDLLEREGRLYAALQSSLGEQRIDIIARSEGAPMGPIHEAARNQGILL